MITITISGPTGSGKSFKLQDKIDAVMKEHGRDYKIVLIEGNGVHHELSQDKPKYAVETLFTYGWENCWQEESGGPTFFDTRQEAQDEINDVVMSNFSYYPDDFRIVEVES